MSNHIFYSYTIVGLNILCELPYEIEILKEATDFLHPLNGDAGNFIRSSGSNYDLNIRLIKVNELPPVPEKAIFEQGRLYNKTGKNVVMYMLKVRNEPPYACTIQIAEKRRFDCLYLEGNESRIQYSRQFSDLIGMETLFLQFQAIILHASFIRWHGQAILFTAPSGTGKSTQADMWKEYENAEIINGDRTGLRLQNGQWRAYGLPYAGSSGIYHNESASVKAIIVLRQAKENRIRPIGPAEAMKYLYPEVFIHRWDREFTEKAINLISQLTIRVPFYMLECLPNKEAVNLVKRTVLGKEGNKDGQYSC